MSTARTICCCWAAALLALGAGACGDSDERDADSTRAPTTPAKAPGLRDPGRDRIVYRAHRFDRGSRAERMRVLRKFRSVQRDFFDGKADAFCDSFNRENLNFDPVGCEDTVREVARRLATGESRWPRHDLIWVRIYHDQAGYDAVAGVTLSDPDDPRLRMGFVKHDGRWWSDFAVPDELDGLNTPLRRR